MFGDDGARCKSGKTLGKIAVGSHRFMTTLLALCIVFCAFTASAIIVFSLAPKPEEHHIDVKDIRKIEERVHHKYKKYLNHDAAHQRIIDAAS
jgi:hypothetical protein